MALTNYEHLKKKIEDTYEGGVSLADAEKLSAEFLHAQLSISSELRDADLDSRMRKSGLKAIRASMYLEIVSRGDKKPTEAAIDAAITSDKIVQGEQDALDRAEANKAELERYYDIFGSAHVYYRQVSRGVQG